MANQLDIKQEVQVLERDESKVICRPHMQDDPAKAKKLLHRILKLDEQETHTWLKSVMEKFSKRHKNLEEIFMRHFQQVHTYLTNGYSFSEEQKLLIGAYFTMEYAIESAALFNPSIVPHPDQANVPEGSLRFIMSLRAVGEGHISSLVFRTGLIHEDGDLDFDSASSYVSRAFIDNPTYKNELFHTKLKEMGACDEVGKHVLSRLSDRFSYEELKEGIAALSEEPRFSSERQQRCFNAMQRLADSNYQLDFDPDTELSEKVIFPISEEEKVGIEDARFVQFHEDDGETIYYATYTAFDGSTIMPQLIKTTDFTHFKMRTLNGDPMKNKDIALFPRKINGQYAMLGRQDGESNYIMFSDHIQFWQDSQIIQEPCEPWELIKIGNCGSPIETPEGWLVLTHGVGPVRVYSLGAILLDLDDPTKVIGRLKEPLLKPLEHQEIGYVPNVVYTCGAMVHNDHLIIPYSLSDVQPAIARLKLDELLDALIHS